MPRIIRVVIIGGGISGIAQAIRLKEQLGDHLSLTILEKGASPGGVWRDAKWPGAGVDVPIHLYSLYSDLNPDWSERFASQPDVLAYWESLIDRHGLRNTFLLNTTYTSSTWSAETQTHQILVTNVETGVKSIHEAEVLISATGPLAKPLLPDVPGIDSFAGPSFHNLRWDTSVDLTGKRVAVVGNGSSGIQFIPGVSDLPGVTLTHYIRSGGYFVPKIQHKYTAFEKFLFRWVPGVIDLHRFGLLLEHDRTWSVRTFSDDKRREVLEKELLEYLEEKAPAEYLEALTPDYPLGAKRTALDFGWLDSLHRDNVSLVNTGIAQVTANGIETEDGTFRAHDVIIWATGSDVARHGLGANVGLHGEDDVELQEFWKDAPQAYRGLAVPGFPNYFIVIGPNATAGSWGWTLGRQSTAIARLVRGLLDYDLSSVQPKQEAFEQHNAEVQEKLANCTARTEKTNNWWGVRVDGKRRITVTNPQSGIDLWWSTLSTKWQNWDAVRLKSVDSKARLEKVDVLAIQRRRHAVKVLLAAGLGAVAYFTPVNQLLTEFASRFYA